MIETVRNEPLILNSTSIPLFNSLVFPAGSYSETYSAPFVPRAHWLQLLSAFEAIGAVELKKYHERAKQMRHEDGATINPFDDPSQRTTSWDLDLVPLTISAAEWGEIEGGLIERATLLEKVLADLYGPQHLLKSGQLPAELVFANPNFLNCCHNIEPPANRFLTFYTADLYRAEDGRFRVFRDYASNPGGLGYALENRIVMSRLFSDLYHKTQILRLAPFFQSFQHAIIGRSALVEEDPGIVLLSPGPDSPIYFEHALLSRYLGYPLVEAQDLTVRNGKVFLKKLDGLEPVEAIFRHISDLNSDPFALRRATGSGVAGLVQVCRENNIDVVNPIGSGFVDTPALPVFLPSLARHLLGKDLKLQNHPAWWCGSKEQLAYVHANLGQLTLSSAFDRHTAIDQSCDQGALINTSPASYMASAPIRPAAVPVWDHRGAGCSYSMLRVFVCATAEGFTVMPGGLAIIAADIETLASNCPERQQSKDIWVLSEKPVETFSLMEAYQSVGEFKRSSDLPSRVADHLLWLGRYLERAEGLIRLLRSIFRRISGEDRPEDIPELMFLLQILQARNIVAAPQNDGRETPQFKELHSSLNNALYQRSQGDSVVSILNQVQQAARKVRDRLSTDSFRIINHLEDLAVSPSYDPLEFLDETLFALSAFSGLAMESMTRSLGWRFMDMGRRIERAVNQIKLISIALPQVLSNSRNTLEALLEVSDSTMTYRSRYRSAFQLAPVLDLLLADENNPKSLAFQFSRLADHVEHMPRQSERRFAYSEERIALKMLTAVRLLDLAGVQYGEENTQNESLVSFLQSMSAYLKEFAQEVTGHYLTRIPATPHFTMINNDLPL
ncbi:MAG: circularly permuted type 2 ATP-grasp protein [Proteobacteria bacterium]|nr:circularly permuted type 2 ATP-grasp protein [Pseudomonadota bacterium]